MPTTEKTPAKTRTTKKTSTKIALSPEKDALLRAITTGDTTGVSIEAVQELLESLGLKAVSKGGAVGPSRTLIVEKWANGETTLSAKEQKTLATLPEVIGTSKIANPDDVTQEEADSVVHEYVTLRDTEDPVSGRKKSIRNDCIAVALARGGESTSIASAKYGYKLDITKKGGVPGEPQVDQLQEILSAEQWERITVEETVRVVDPTLLALAIKDAEIYKAVQEVTHDVPVTYAVTPRVLKDGEVV